jgi:hypothetical protein
MIIIMSAARIAMFLFITIPLSQLIFDTLQSALAAPLSRHPRASPSIAGYLLFDDLQTESGADSRQLSAPA